MSGTPPPPTVPATWREYFTLCKEASQAQATAQRNFNEAGKALTACTDRVQALEAWAKSADKVSPYHGSVSTDDVIEDSRS